MKLKALSILAIALCGLLVHCSSAHAEDAKLTCVHIGKTTICTKN
jgi:hypothetical protein